MVIRHCSLTQTSNGCCLQHGCLCGIIHYNCDDAKFRVILLLPPVFLEWGRVEDEQTRSGIAVKVTLEGLQGLQGGLQEKACGQEVRLQASW